MVNVFMGDFQNTYGESFPPSFLPPSAGVEKELVVYHLYMLFVGMAENNDIRIDGINIIHN